MTLALVLLAALVVRERRVRRRAQRAERALQVSEEQYRLLFEQNPNPMWVYDRATLRFLAVNEAAVRQYGYSEEEFLAMTVRQIRPVRDALPPRPEREVDTSRRLRRHQTSAGETIDVEVSARNVRFRDRHARLVLAEDVTRREQAAAAVEESGARYRDLFENATAPFATLDLEERITEVNTAFAEVLGYGAEEMVGTRIDAYLAAADLGVAEEQLERKLRGDANITRYEQQFIAKDGRSVVLEVETRLIQRDGRPAGTQGICRDVTAQKQAERELRELAALSRRQALEDPLSGLPNRLSFMGAVQTALAVGGDGGSELAVMLIDLDRFKEINDTLGHEHGDLLLIELARALRSGLRESDVLARLGGDEFGILLEAPTGHVREACDATLERIGQLLRRPVVVDSLPLSVEASIGVACHPSDGDTADRLLQRADIALYRAKRDGASYAYYRPELDRHDKTRLHLLGELRRALDENELVLHYQPKLSLHDGTVRRVEALVRWAHPTRGLLPPCEFIELAEQTGLMGPLTLYVIEAALRQTQRWEAEGQRLDVAVNLSARNLGDPTFPDAVAALLDRYADTPGRLLLELTESTLIADHTSAVAVLQQLAALGIGLALDDFGSGYTSLASLSRLPLHQIKIDRSFVTDLVENPQHAAIVRSIIHLAHDLELEVVGEGVETAAVNSRLKHLGCDVVQGYYYTPPLPPDELVAWVRQRRSIAAVA